MLHGRSCLGTPLSACRCGVDLDLAIVTSGVEHPHLQRGPFEAPGRRAGPLDEGDRLRAHVVLENRRVFALQRFQPVEVEMGDGDSRAAVDLADREGRRCDRIGDPQGPAGAADQRRLAGPQVARDDDDGTRAEPGGDLGPDRFGFLGRVGRGGSPEEAHLLFVGRPRGIAGVRLLGRLLTVLRLDSRDRRRAARGSSRSPRAGSPSPPGCAGRPPGGRAAAGRPARPPSSWTWGVPRTLVIPVGLPLRSLVAKFPSVQTTVGSISCTCSNR